MGNNVTEILIATWFSPLYRIMWRRIAAVVQVDLTDSISVETKVYCLRQRYFVWDEDILSETYKLLLPLQFHSIYSLPPYTLFSPAINSFPPLRLLNLLAIHSITLALLPLLPKSLSLLTAHLSSTLIYYNHFNSHLLRLSITTLTSQIGWIMKTTFDRYLN